MLKKISFVLIVLLPLFLLLFSCGNDPIDETIDVPPTWETGTTPAGSIRINNPVVYSINPPVAGNYPQGLFKYHYRIGIDWYQRETFTQTLDWFPSVKKTFDVNKQYVARLTLDPVRRLPDENADVNRTFKGTLQENVLGLPEHNVEKINAEIIGESLVIYIVFNKTASKKAAAQLVFEDNFTGTSLDTTKWNTSPEWDRQGRSSWRSDMVEVSGGNLRIKFRRDTTLGNAKAQATPGRFTREQNANNWIRTGGVRTLGTNYTQKMFEHSYGWYEARIKFPKVQGTWGAFWLMSMTFTGQGNKGEFGTEIDILESIGNAANRWNYAVHWGFPTAQNPFSHDSHSKDFFQQNTLNNGKNLNIYDGNFHVFALDWSPSEYVFYINGIEMGRIPDNGGPAYNNLRINRNPNYMKLSVEAANWDQLLPAGFTEGEMLVDYVRVYNQPQK